MVAAFVITSKQQDMKRAVPWRDDEDDETSSSDESSSLDSSTEDDKASTKNGAKNKKGTSKLKTSQVESTKRKSKRIDFEALSRHGYKDGPSVLSVPLPKEPSEGKQDWSWSTGKETPVKEIEETYAERQKMRAAIVEGEQPANVQTQKEKKNLSFSQRVKKKRDLGQSVEGRTTLKKRKDF